MVSNSQTTTKERNGEKKMNDMRMNEKLNNQDVLIVTLQFEFHGGIEQEETYLFNRKDITLEQIGKMREEYENEFAELDGEERGFDAWMNDMGIQCEIMNQSRITYGVRNGSRFTDISKIA